MFCPNCGYPQKCSCDGPVCGAKDGQVYKGNDMLSYFKCGLTRHIDWWADLEWNICKDDRREYER